MFDKIGRMAEQAATSASRRQFLGRLGRAALAAAAAAGGILALPHVAEAQTGVCNSQSSPPCRGRSAGSPCRVGSTVGHCRLYGNGACYCQ